MGLIPKFGRKGKRDILGYSLNQYAQDLVGYGGNLYGLSPQTTYGSNPQQEPASNFEGIVQGVYKTNGVVFACMVARMLLFAEARFKYRRIRAGRPGELWGNKDLGILERPWPNGTTGDLLNRMIQDADLCGNFFAARRPNGIKRMHPEWVTIILGSRNDPNLTAYDLDAEVVGYLYTPGGKSSGNKSVALLPEEVCHFAPIPDPFASYRGMSWVTPIIREVMGDNAARDHKLKFFENAATPNMVVSLDKDITSEQFKDWIEIFEGEHKGYWNAYKTLYLGGGAQTTVVGKDMHELDFKVTQGAGETRIAAAAGVPPVIVGLSEGLQAATYSNYGQARRRFADMTMRPLWRNAAASMATIVPVPSDSELWYDDRDIPALQDDAKDTAEMMRWDSVTIKTLIEAGYEPDAVIDSVSAKDFSSLSGKHTGLVTVQLQPPGAATVPGDSAPDDPAPPK